MRKIINGKLYDTNTAELIDTYYNEYPASDFKHYSEELYKKKTGEFFLYGEGGALSKYAKSCGTNSWTGGSALTPLTEEEAKKWLEEYSDVGTYAKHFGLPEEQNPKSGIKDLRPFFLQESPAQIYDAGIVVQSICKRKRGTPSYVGYPVFSYKEYE